MMSILCPGWLLVLVVLHGISAQFPFINHDIDTGIMVDQRKIHFSEVDGEEYGYIHVPSPEEILDPVDHQLPKDDNNLDAHVVINVEDADKVRRPHMYPNDPVISNLMKKRQMSMQTVAIVGAILLTIVALTGLVCLCRRMRESVTLAARRAPTQR